MSMNEQSLTVNDVRAEILYDSGDGRQVDYIMKIAGQEYEVSRQIYEDPFTYDVYKCAAPPYNLDALLYFFDNNTWHSRCCRLKAACTVGLGFVLQLIKGKTEEKKELEKLEKFFRECNPIETFGEILEKFMIDYEALGNAYLEIVRNISGEIVSIHHVPAQTMRVRLDRDGFVQLRDVRYVFFKNFGDERIYTTAGDLSGTAPEVALRATEIIHFFQYSPRSTYYGVPEWVASMASMLGSEKASDYNIQFFDNNAVPQFAVIVKKATLGQPVKDVIAQYFRKEIKAKHHKTLVLEAPGEAEIDLKPLATETKEQSFRFYRLDNRDEVIAAHGVPPRMVGVIAPGALGGKGDPEGQKEAFLSQIIEPRQRRLNHRINKLLMTKGIGALNYEFVLESLNPTSENDESERFERYIKIGVLTINKVREFLRLPRYDFPEADEPFIFTSSGPILVSSLKKYMEVALMPKQPSSPEPPGLPGGKGVSTDDDGPKRVTKILEEIMKIREDLANELGKQQSQATA